MPYDTSIIRPHIELPIWVKRDLSPVDLPVPFSPLSDPPLPAVSPPIADYYVDLSATVCVR